MSWLVYKYQQRIVSELSYLQQTKSPASFVVGETKQGGVSSSPV